jgi:predicted MPP superfamily phosphohydrolase
VRVGFASDLHLGPTTPARLLDAAFGYLEGAELDVLLLGGDYVFLEATAAKARELAARVAAVPARRKLAVLGNHDLWTSHGTLEAALRGVGVEVLVNESVALGGGVQVVGLDDPWTGRRDTAQAFTGMGDAHAVVVLCHSPDSLWDAKSAVPEGVAAFYVCGHTHGGHLATPWGPLVVPGPVGKRYPRGEHQIGSLRLCVSRGVGGIELPIRTYARPEVHVFELVTSSSVRGAAPTSAADPGGAEP